MDLLRKLLIRSTFGRLGTECPEVSKPHQTRCDMYFKCAVLPSNTLLWMPKKCDQGLVYEHTVRFCVLPGKKNYLPYIWVE